MAQPEQNPVNQVQVTQTEQNPAVIQDQTLSKEENKKESNKNEIQGNKKELNKSSKRELESDDSEEKKATQKKTKIQEMAKSDNAPKNIDQNIIKSVKEIGQDAFVDLVQAQKASILQDVEQRKQENDKKTSLLKR
jgi:hypothetical protein